MKGLTKRWLKDVPYLKQVFRERDQLRLEVDRLRTERDRQWADQDRLQAEQEQLKATKEQLIAEVDRWSANQHYLPGHFYSPLPNLADVRDREREIFETMPRSLPGIDLNESGQLDLLNQLQQYYADLPFTPAPQPHLRYFYDNDYYCYSDAIFLYAILRHFRPRRLIEVGSGFSSAIVLDTNELFLDRAIDCTFIEPNPERLLTLLRPEDQARTQLISQPLQAVPLDRFAQLEAGDILFIDSTHVVKTGGDVNYLLFEILPRLATGVYIHFHDIFYPFEYIRDWVYQGRAWNECYFLRSFLQYNSMFQIMLFNTFLEQFHTHWFEQHMPLCLRNWGGSLWLKKIG